MNVEQAAATASKNHFALVLWAQLRDRVRSTIRSELEAEDRDWRDKKDRHDSHRKASPGNVPVFQVPRPERPDEAAAIEAALDDITGRKRIAT